MSSAPTPNTCSQPQKRTMRCKHSDPLCSDCQKELDGLYPQPDAELRASIIGLLHIMVSYSTSSDNALEECVNGIMTLANQEADRRAAAVLESILNWENEPGTNGFVIVRGVLEALRPKEEQQ